LVHGVAIDLIQSSGNTSFFVYHIMDGGPFHCRFRVVLTGNCPAKNSPDDGPGDHGSDRTAPTRLVGGKNTPWLPYARPRILASL
jgi:hypothetical protein